MKRALALVVGSLALSGALLTLRDAGAQRLDPRRPATFVVGTPGGASPMHRVDARRTGLAKNTLPTGTIHVAWRKTIGLGIDQPVLVGKDESIAVVTTRGDVVFLDSSGQERARVTIDARTAGPSAMTSDGTVVFATNTGDAAGIRLPGTRPRFLTRIGGDRNVFAAPLPLDDGGTVLATMTDLVVIDAEGNVRARVSLPEGAAHPLIAAGDKIVAIAATGAVYGWTPGREAVRLGSFGTAVDGGAALADSGSLVAVVEGNQLAELDLRSGTLTTRGVASQGLYLGPPSLRRVPQKGTLASVLTMTSTRAFVATIDPGGQEVARAPVGTVTLGMLPDGGPAPLVAPPHSGVLLDARGAVAFAAPDGHVGMITPEGTVDTLGELLCSKNGRSAGIAGLTPAAAGAFLVACEGGAIVKVTGPGGPKASPAEPPDPSAGADGADD